MKPKDCVPVYDCVWPLLLSLRGSDILFWLLENEFIFIGDKWIKFVLFIDFSFWENELNSFIERK